MTVEEWLLVVCVAFGGGMAPGLLYRLRYGRQSLEDNAVETWKSLRELAQRVWDLEQAMRAGDVDSNEMLPALQHLHQRISEDRLKTIDEQLLPTVTMSKRDKDG
jgi:hypothetical protein